MKTVENVETKTINGFQFEKVPYYKEKWAIYNQEKHIATIQVEGRTLILTDAITGRTIWDTYGIGRGSMPSVFKDSQERLQYLTLATQQLINKTTSK